MLLMSTLAGPSAATPVTAPATKTGKAVTLTGVYREVHGETKLSEKTLRFLEVGGVDGDNYRLRGGTEKHLHSGAEVTVKGSLTGHTLDVTSGDVAVHSSAPSAVALGPKRVLAINVASPNSSLTATQAQEQNFLFGSDSRSLASYYSDVSYGQMSWTGTKTPTYAVSDSGTCDLYGLADQAKAAATADGYNPGSYDALIINAPALHCGSAGIGEIGGKLTWIEDGLWNLADGYARLVASHEIGHALGLYHSHGLECGATTVTSTCLKDAASHNEEYGNAWDVMGNNWPGDGNDSVTWFSARQASLLGWLAGRVTNVSASGSYSLAPLEQQTAAPQVLVLPTPLHTYYVEYRQPIGQDAFLADYPAATNSVHVSVTNNIDSGPAALDFTPESDTSGGYFDWFDAPLAMGRSFTDPENTFTISPVSHDGSRATVKVTLTGPPTRYPLSVSRSGTGAGAVTSSPSGISCGATCSASYPSGTSVTLTAAPASGSTFSGWSGACAGSTTCTVGMTSSKTVTAAFATVPAARTYQETSASLNGWKARSDASYSGGAYRSTAVAGDFASFKFTATGITWVTHRGPAFGKAAVSIDGVSKGTVDLYAATSGSYSKAFTGLTSAAHTIKVVAAGTKNAAATGLSVPVDGFKVGTTSTEEKAPAVTFVGWPGASSASANGGAYRSATAATANTSLTFTGTAVDWVTASGPSYGRASVTIDGVGKGTFDLYASTQHWKLAKTFSGLASGSHTIKVQVLGTKNTSATGTRVVLDAFVVK